MVRPLSAGLIAGAALGVAWVAARRYGRGRADQILDWEQIRSIAVRASSANGPLSADERTSIEEAYTRLVRDIAEPVAAYTGTGLTLAETEVRALDRPEWIDANISNFRDLLQPFEQLYREAANPGRFDLPGVTAVGRLLLSGELGFLLGYLSRRVLGQYDISLLGARATEPGKLYFIEPNIRAVQQQLALPDREFRVWLALHETTHAHEFEGHPWVRDYLNTTLQDYLGSMVDALRDGAGERVRGSGALTATAQFVSRAADRLALGGTLLEAIMTPQQRELVSRLQALMCLLEGYSNHVMQVVGQTLLPHFAE
ncbi:MAG TPA: zinc-dependent metalloprotease, partial [Gemmatimonadales bacterium]|nr:zinc-dependent metalloprotease [Gemmatimonadales bacterium]